MTKANAFTENLGTDWVATDAAGTPIARASDEAGLRQAAPDAHAYLNAKTLVLDGQDLPRAAEGSVNSALDKVAAQSQATSSVVVNPSVQTSTTELQSADQPKSIADGSRFDHDGDGKAGGAPKGGNRKAAKK